MGNHKDHEDNKHDSWLDEGGDVALRTPPKRKGFLTHRRSEVMARKLLFGMLLLIAVFAVAIVLWGGKQQVDPIVGVWTPDSKSLEVEVKVWAASYKREIDSRPRELDPGKARVNDVLRRSEPTTEEGMAGAFLGLYRTASLALFADGTGTYASPLAGFAPNHDVKWSHQGNNYRIEFRMLTLGSIVVLGRVVGDALRLDSLSVEPGKDGKMPPESKYYPRIWVR